MRLGIRRLVKATRPVALLLALLAACGGQTAGNNGGSGNSGSGGSGSGADARLATAAAVAIASDSTGTNLVMVGGGIWTSTNGGQHLDRAGPFRARAHSAMDVGRVRLDRDEPCCRGQWFLDTPNADPAEFSGDVWTSTDGGATWTDQTASSPAHHQAWRSVASDASGTNLVAVTAGLGVFGPGAIWTSTNAGVTWTNRTAAQAGMGRQSWSSVASDATGKNLVAVGAALASRLRSMAA